jgi:archaellum biogenesis ATPase FlaH
MLGMQTTMDAITTGMKEIAEALGGGINEGSLVMIEGEAKSGKSVLSQYIAYGILCSKDSAVAYYKTDNSGEDLIAQMDSISLSVKQEFVTDRFRIYTMDSGEVVENIKKSFRPLLDQIMALPQRFKLVIMDSITPLLLRESTVVKIDFLQAFKELCEEQNRSMVMTADTLIFDKKTLYRAHAMSDYYLRLRSKDVMIGIGQVDTRVIKILDVTKLGGADRQGQGDMEFEIKPKVGIQILPLVRVKV